nr:S1 RNA-binding domain-containing protein [Deltaproteobacteria bacterium]
APQPRLDGDALLALASMSREDLDSAMKGALVATRIEPGSRVTGRVTRVGRDDVFVDLGGKSEGQIERSELPDAAPGDEISAFVLDVDENGIQLSMKLSGGAAAEHLEQAKLTGVPIEGKVASRNAGGYEVRIGSTRAFCPSSHISRLREVDPDAYIGQTLQFRVLETGDKIVVSRRVLQDAEAEIKAGELWGRIDVGQEHRGVVRNVLNFGAFVDVGGIEGLVPRREISWAGNADPTTVLRPGQAVEVRVLEIDRENRKLTLSARSLEDDPWHSVGTEFLPGSTYKGKVVKLETFGAFVELAPGLTGLAHASRLHGATWTVGEDVEVTVMGLDNERRRIELAPAGSPGAPEPAATEVRGTITDVMANGVSVRLEDGRTGWLSAREVDLPSGTVLAQRYRQGRSITARVLAMNGARVDLTVRSDDEEKNWRSELRQSNQPVPPAKSGFGTFGELLGKALKK